MGCGKSKHDVVAGTTVSKSMKSASDNGGSPTKNVEIASENTTVNASLPPPPEQIVPESVVERTETAAPTENTEAKTEVVKEEEEEEEIKDLKKENVESVISEGLSGKTTYYSPNVKEEDTTKVDVDEDEKINVVEESTLIETQKEEDGDVTEEKPIETEPLPIDKPEEVLPVAETNVVETKETEPETK